MSLSRTALLLAAKVPRLAEHFVRLWAWTYSWRPRPTHWLLSRLKFDLRLRLSRRVRLVTGQQIIVDPFDHIGRDIAQNGCYEPETVDLFRAVLSPGMNVIDAGAHVGQYTLIAAQFVGAAGRVHAFEPDPTTLAQLRNNIALNKCSNVELNEAALSDKPGQANLYLVNALNIGENSLQPSKPGALSIAVPVLTVDGYVAEKKVERLDLLKADVEGAELALLHGAEETLRRFKPALILELSVHCARFGYSKEDLCSYLQGLGYRIFRVAAQPLVQYKTSASDPEYFNVLGVHTTSLDPLLARRIIVPPDARHS